MKKSLIVAAILMAGSGAVALAADCNQCKKDAAQQLKSCLEKAPGEKAQQVCRTRAQKATESCDCKVTGK
jgi:hypothetical protein